MLLGALYLFNSKSLQLIIEVLLMGGITEGWGYLREELPQEATEGKIY